MNGQSDGTAHGYPATQYPSQHPSQQFPPQYPGQYPAPGQYPQAHAWPQEPYAAQAGPVVATGNTLSVVAIVLGVVALIVLPPVFGIAGIVCACVAMKKGERLAKVGLGVSIGGMVVGMIVGFLVFSALS